MIIPIHIFTNFENLVKIGAVFAEIFGGICYFLFSSLTSFCKHFNLCPRNLWGYWIKVYLISTQCSDVIAAVNVCIHVGILQFVIERQRKE